MRTLADVIAFNRKNADQELAFFGQETLIQAEAKGPLSEDAYLNAVATCIRLSRTEGIDALMSAHRLDAIVSLTTGPAGVSDPVFGGSAGGLGGSSTFAAVAGYPAITLPAATLRGLPVGVSFFGRAWTDAALLALALDFEHRTRARVEPEFRPTLEAR